MSRRIQIIEMQRPGIDGAGLTAPEKAQLVNDVAEARNRYAATLATLDSVSSRMDNLDDVIEGLPTGDVPMPVFPDLYVHVDAQAIAANDQTRMAAWDNLAGTPPAPTQANAALQPLYMASGINGRPSVKFTNARNDSLTVTEFTPNQTLATIFVVAAAGAVTGNQSVLGTNKLPLNMYVNRAQGIVGVAGGTGGIAPTVPPDPPHIITTFNGNAGVVRIDGVETTGTIGGLAAPLVLTIGHRASLAAGQGFDGMIGEVLYYNRELTAGERQSVERYLSAKWGIPIAPQAIWYVDTMGGRDANTGRSAGTAVATMERAWQGIAAAKTENPTVFVHAPASKPLRLADGNVPFIREGAGVVRLLPTIQGDAWHQYGTERFTSGWTAVGGGVYSRPLARSAVAFPIAFVQTILDSDMQPVRIASKNTATPTAPAAGQYGYTGGTYYIHLPGDANPNQHAIEVVNVRVQFLTRSGGRIDIQGAHLLGGQDSVVQSGSSAVGYEGGYIELTDCVADLALTGSFSTSGFTEGMKATRCLARYCDNDGFNVHASPGVKVTIELVDCEGAYNGDEGVSPHDDVTLILRDGEFHHNGHGGLTSVTNAVTYVYGTEFYQNRRVDSTLTGWDSGGVSILENSKLISLDLYSRDHPGAGVEIDTAGGATWTDNGGTRSGTAHGNGAPDIT